MSCAVQVAAGHLPVVTVFGNDFATADGTSERGALTMKRVNCTVSYR